MFFIKQFLFVLFALSSKTCFLHNVATTTISPTIILNSNNKSSVTKIVNTNSSVDEKENEKISISSSEDIISSDTTADEIKNEVSVNELLETSKESVVIVIPEIHQGPHYEIDWSFIDKDTIRVTFDLFSIPKSLIENNIYSEKNKRKLNLLATMTTMPSNSLKSIFSLEYFLFIIRPYNQNREIILKMEKLNLKNTTLNTYSYFSNSLRLTSLNHNEKYSICICYYQTNSSTKTPDLLLCQDVINDYAKFAHLRADPTHGLFFITTQYSIIIGLLVVLQSIFSIRKRRITQYITQHLTTTAHNIRTTLSSVSLGRQSCSSLDAAAEQQQHSTKSHTTQREPTIGEEKKIKKRIISSPAIVINQLSVPTNDGATSSDETEPFLKNMPSKNHVHFLLGPGEGSDNDDEDNENEDVHNNKSWNPQSTPTHEEPYQDQADALLSMAHILDTNKPWSRHSQHTSPV
ncbi:unnamed protein product [Rotaria sp. Silwood1]|nr:unnamed protein product [Rotaria sp. Silwood1]CAF0752199.1 unnamed protein product [Rotaria sp. Silwood1]CAF3349433.1 unnamed protein product [Rotaria sp. Silwood1]CAF3362694.1 unnamed protein product [Rotaria sp. Silwood1]CAF4535875.1 unnamed protein product [Rotaria sp. Silwood1]